jgi:hypothetical protein
MMKKGYFAQFAGTINDTFRSVRLNIFVSSLHDFLFYLCSFLIFRIWSYLSNLQGAKIAINPSTFDLANSAVVKLAMDSAQDFLIFMAFSIVAFFVVVVLLFSFFKPLAWFVFLKRKLSFSFYRRFCLLNLIWFSVWITIIILAALVFQPTAGLVVECILLFLLAHLTAVLIFQFSRHQQIRKSFRMTFRIGLGRFHHFILPYLVVLIAYFIVLQSLNVLWFFTKSEYFELIYGMLFAMIHLLYFSIVRLYFVNVVKEL